MSIKELADRYNNIQIQMGKDDVLDWSSDINALFAEDFTKTANGSVLVNNRSELQNQIIMCREGAGRWQIDVKDVIPSYDNHKCTIHFVLTSEKAGNFDIIAILTGTNDQKIASVNEVFYQVQ